MAKIEGVLKISDDELNGELDAFVSTNKSNNISLYPYTQDILPFVNGLSDENNAYGGALVTTIGTTSSISNLRFGALLSSGNRESQYKGLLLGNTDANKNLIITLSLTGDKIIGLKIKFDNYSNQYPTQYSYTDVRGHTEVETNNTNKTITITGMPAEYGTVTITFTKWNLANYPVGITFIDFPTETKTLTKAQIISFESQSQLVTSTSGLNYSVIPSTGKIEINDANNVLYKDAKKGYLNAYLFTLELKANDKAIQKHISTNSPLYTADRKIELNLSDELSLWDNIIVPEKTYNYQDTLYDVLSDLVTYDTNLDIDVLCSDDIVVGSDFPSLSYRSNWGIKDYLESLLFTQSTTLKEGTLRQQFEKICACAQLVLYINRDNEIKFMSARPVVSNEFDTNVIEIPYGKQYEKASYDILMSNRYEDVEFK